MFKFDLRRDAEVTGRMEVFLYPNSSKQNDQLKHMVHSKVNAGHGIPSEDWAAFDARLDAFMRNVKS